MQPLADAIRKFPVSSWLRNHTKIYDDGHGENFYADCPICKRKRKLGVHRIDKRMHCFYCHETGHHGDVWSGKSGLVRMVMLLERRSQFEAIQFIFHFVGEDAPVVYRQQEAAKLPEEFIPFSRCSKEHASYQTLIRRGVGHLADKAGVCITGRYENRIILPVWWLGAFVGFEAKTYVGSEPKTLYPSWFHTGDYLYMNRYCTPGMTTLIITESILDAETLRLPAAGLFGSSLKEGQINRLFELKELGLDMVVWLLDGDAWKKQARCAMQTASFLRTAVTALPDKEDPNSLGWQGIAPALAKAQIVCNQVDLALAAGELGKTILDF